MTKDDLERLTLSICVLKQQFIQMTEKPVRMNYHSLIINEDIISIEDPKLYEFDLVKLSKSYKKFECNNQIWSTMAANDQVLLIDQYPNITLVDRDLNIVKQSVWPYGFIRCMRWSSTLTSFIIINMKKSFFLLRMMLY
ncbi:unnamed protein product [Rotaria magnacalcarata]|uniref:Uncharacterized protein n=1 Tax=Rotaria magnacalcarata TaxID=392030 RepID=A0A816LV56_9BILA|nr:unnamed protein product [Rotaria magnacalcarata]CAF1216584.1 unnamed protein product [Rotaria magnacalcarata]CAF1944266.1 unnamed protein product [Rotaria magnacalcarata]CAF1950056.1 unnamed protein product [Rotaria magnacalcarata]CAF2081536.1 unnamed protein product [Rotaria magnacalcarata]